MTITDTLINTSANPVQTKLEVGLVAAGAAIAVYAGPTLATSVAATASTLMGRVVQTLAQAAPISGALLCVSVAGTLFYVRQNKAQAVKNFLNRLIRDIPTSYRNEDKARIVEDTLKWIDPFYQKYCRDPEAAAMFQEYLLALDPTVRNDLISKYLQLIENYKDGGGWRINGRQEVLPSFHYVQLNAHMMRLSSKPHPNVLFQAVKDQDYARIQWCLDSGLCSLETPDGQQIIFEAVRKNDVGLMRLLFQKYGVRLDQRPLNFDVATEIRSIEMFNLFQEFYPSLDLTHRNPCHDTLLSFLFYQSLNNSWFEKITPQEKANCLKLAEYILAKNPQLAKQTNSSGTNLISWAYQGWKNAPCSGDTKSSPTWEKIFRLLYQAYQNNPSSPLPQEVIDDMQIRYLQGQTKWGEFLPNRSELDAIKHQSKDTQFLYKKLVELKAELEKQKRLCHLCPDNISLPILCQSYDLKKKLKTLNPRTLDDNFKKEIRSFIVLYDELVDKHPVMREFRAASRDLRKNITVNEHRAKRIFGTWLRRSLDLSTTAKRRDLMKTEGAQLRQRIAKASVEANRLLATQGHLRILHGTRSSSLPLLQATNYTFVSSGELFRRNIAPLTGEGTGAFSGGINENYISVVEPEHTLEGTLSALNVNDTNFGIAEAYATEGTQIGKSMVFNPAHEWNILDNFKSEMKKNIPFYDLFAIKRAILRLRQTDPQFFQKVAELKESVRNHQHPNILSLLPYLETPAPVQIDTSDPKVKNPYPVLLASHTKLPDPVTRSGAAVNNKEFYVREMRLGKDVQTVFTADAEVARLQSQLAPLGVEVLPFDVGRYLELHQMSVGSQLSTNRVSNPVELLTACRDFHQRVLPHYARPFPEKPFYYDDKGIKQSHDRAYYGHESGDYSDYMKKVEQGTVLPRTLHGCKHSANVALFGYMIAQLYEQAGVKLTVPAGLLIRAAGMHDAARQDEGKDQWDGASAKLLEKQLEAGNREDYRKVKGDAEMVPSGFIKVLTDAVENKETFENERTPLERICVHDADCLDIHRFPRTFRREELWFLKDPRCIQHFGQDKLNKLVDEVASFVKATENEGLKKALETQTEDYLGDLCRIFMHLHAKGGQYPMMNELLKPLLQANAGQPLNPNFIQFLA